MTMPLPSSCCPRSERSRCYTAFVLGLLLLFLVGTATTTRAQPGTPVYSVILIDCVWPHNASNEPTRYLDKTLDKLLNGDACDDYSVDRYERPTGQQTSLATLLYYPDVDIERADYGMDDDWFYFRLDLIDRTGSTPELNQQYGFVLDLDANFRGDFIIIVEQPNAPEHHTTGWTDKKVSIYYDSNAQTAADPGVGATNQLTSDCTSGSSCSYTTDGYDCKFYTEGESSSPPARVRIDATDPTRVEFAVEKNYLLTHNDSDCSGTNRFNASSPFTPLVQGWANRGLTSVTQMNYHDHYDASAAGEPYPDGFTCKTGGTDPCNSLFPPGNIYELDVISGTSTPLPVELVAFDAVLDGREVLLTWKTASETNNAGFEVQHRYIDDATSIFEAMTFVEGHGTTEQPQSYSYRVDDLAPGRHAFRLKQIDFDGAFEYSPEVEVIVEMVERFVIEPAYPNPFNPEAQFRFAVQREQVVRVDLYDVLGRHMKVLYEGQPSAGQMHTVRIDGSNLPSGLYIVHVAGETFAKTQQVMLLK